MKSLIVANWKLNKNKREALEWVKQISKVNLGGVEVVVCVSFPLLPIIQLSLSGRQAGNYPFIHLGAQDLSQFEEGSYTGEVSAKQLSGLVKYAIVGHSERRMYFGENNESVAKKVANAVKYGITPLVCVADRLVADGQVPKENVNFSEEHFSKQVSSAFKFLKAADYQKVILVYEPISAISTFGNQPISGQEASKMAVRIKEIAGINTPVLYGGSVDETNIKEYIMQQDIDGALVGAASLDAKKFGKIIQMIR